MAVAEDKTAPKASHVSDPALAPFLQQRFDPAEYLNATLPSLSLAGGAARPLKSGNAASLADLSSQTQDLLSQLNAHTTRLSAILTQLTDDILRSGARLAYEVEVLRGETIGLTETLTDDLKPDVEKFLPGGIKLQDSKADESLKSPTLATSPTEAISQPFPPLDPEPDTTPDYLSDLRTLTTVRSRLESVIKVFGEAMHWTLPPSDISLTSSLISVSAPDPTTSSTSQEQKGKEFAAALRAEIADLITGDPDAGREKAEVRIQALRDLATVWKGTAEEKARGKFVEGLVKVAEEKGREVERNKGQRSARSGSVVKEKTVAQSQKAGSSGGGGGFLENLQRIRGFVEQ